MTGTMQTKGLLTGLLVLLWVLAMTGLAVLAGLALAVWLAPLLP